ncbi:MAG: hypothetical protein LBT00_08710 [Spirochaetaceae bacterium]|jgi:hypothetical protein|nr:hypothetical protein [Spirochaetaceae bacterium]
MKKNGMAVLAVLFGMANALWAQTAAKTPPAHRDEFDWEEWQHGFFLDAGVLGNYEDADPPEGLRIETTFLLLEIGGGYDFGCVTVRLYGDFGFPLSGNVYWADGVTYVEESLDTSNGKFGMEAAFKIIDTRSFDFLLPLGLVFSKTVYTQKNPSYTQSGHAFDRKWIYEYTTVTAGLDFTIRLNNHLKLRVISRAAYPLESNYTHKMVLQGNYVFADTGSKEYSVEGHTNIVTFSAGLGLRVNF